MILINGKKNNGQNKPHIGNVEGVNFGILKELNPLILWEVRYLEVKQK